MANALVADLPRAASLSGSARPILTGERTALNFLQTLLGHRHRGAAATSKPSPARAAASSTRARRCPGCGSRRNTPRAAAARRTIASGLYDMVLIKENHIIAAGSIAHRHRHGAPNFARHPGRSGSGIARGIRPGARGAARTSSCSTNSRSTTCATPWRAIARTARKAKLEASGSVTLDTVREIALTGVDYISIGGITKHVQAVDLSMRFEFAA